MALRRLRGMRAVMVLLWIAVAVPAVVAGVLTKNYLVIAIPIFISALGILVTLYVPSHPKADRSSEPLPPGKGLTLAFAVAACLWFTAWLSFNLKLDCADRANSIKYRVLCDFAFWGDYLGISRTYIVGSFLTLLGALCVLQAFQRWRLR